VRGDPEEQHKRDRTADETEYEEGERETAVAGLILLPSVAAVGSVMSHIGHGVSAVIARPAAPVEADA
jgi:hypothetical protein